MKRIIICLLAALLLTSLTACSEEITGILDELPEEMPEETRLPEETPEDPTDDSTPEDAGNSDSLDGLVSAPSGGGYPELVELYDLPEDGTYTSKDDVALYIYGYGHLPDNFITKNEARNLGWNGGGLDPYAPGMCIGGDRFGNYEGILPDVDGRTYYECDIDTLNASSRGAKRLVYCLENEEDGRQVYYTEDHYESFELVYGDDPQ